MVDGTLRLRARSALLTSLSTPGPLDAESRLDTGDDVERQGQPHTFLGQVVAAQARAAVTTRRWVVLIQLGGQFLQRAPLAGIHLVVRRTQFIRRRLEPLLFVPRQRPAPCAIMGLMTEVIDIAIIGGGVVGAAVFAELAKEGRSVWLLERSRRIGGEISERNSGVIHAGLYSPPCSLKTELCVEGRHLLYAWVKRWGVPHARLGKLIVATDPDEEAALSAMLAHGQAVGVQGLRLLPREALSRREPEVRGLCALLSEETGIVDPCALTRSLAAAGESRRGEILVAAEVRSVARVPDGWALDTARGPVVARTVVNAAGLRADDVARLAGVDRYRIYPCRGDYFRWRTAARFKHLVYPVRKPGAPGLGVHLTVDLAGAVRFGPDATYVERKDDFTPPPEGKRSIFASAAQKLFRHVRAGDLEPDLCGIRPKLRGPLDTEERDFVIAEDAPGFVNLVGIESPGLTSALAIAQRVRGMLSTRGS